MRSITRLALRRPWLTLLAWALVIAALAGPALSVDERLSPTALGTEGTPSARAAELARVTFGRQATIVVHLRGPGAEVRAQASGLTAALRARGGVRVVTPFERLDRPDARRLAAVLHPEDGTAFLVAVIPTTQTIDPGAAKVVREAVDATVAAPVSAGLTGYSVIGEQFVEAAVAAAHDAEKIAVPVLMLVLLLVLRTVVAAALPLVLGVANVVAVLGLIAVVTRVTELGDVAGSIGSMLGLALGVDYALLVLARHREEVRAGAAYADAAVAAADTAGHTVRHAATALLVVMAGAALLAPTDVLRSAAIATTLAGLVGTALALTAMPALLTLAGPRIDRGRLGRPPGDGARWAAFAGGVMRRPALAAAPAALVLLALAPAAVGLDTGPPDPRTLPADNIARVDGERVARAIGPGWGGPVEVLVQTPAEQERSAVFRAARDRWIAGLGQDPRIAAVVGPSGTGTLGAFTQLARAAGPQEPVTTRYAVVPRGAPNDASTAGLVDDLREGADGLAGPAGGTAAVGGVAAELVDMRRSVGDSLLWVIVGLTILTTVALVLVLRTVVLPLVSVVLNLVTVAAAFGVLALVSTGPDPLIGGAGFADQLTVLATFAVVFALSLDYQVFILTRILEEHRATGDVRLAVQRAIGRTAGVITGAAAIMCAVFVAFTVPEVQTLRQSGVVLAAAIVIDATLVRLVLLPAAIGALGPRAIGWGSRAARPARAGH